MLAMPPRKAADARWCAGRVRGRIDGGSPPTDASAAATADASRNSRNSRSKPTKGTKAKKGVTLLMGLLRANRTLTTLSLSGMTAEAVPLLAQAVRTNTTLQTVHIEQSVTGLRGSGTVTAALPVQALTGASGDRLVDLSACGELSKITCATLGAMLSYNASVTSLRLSGTKLGDEAGGLLPMLGDKCKTGTLSELDLSDIGLTDRGARKLFEAIAGGE